MKVLVAGGSGLVGKAAIDHLVLNGHTVRLLSRHASNDVRGWAEGVEPFDGDLADPDTLLGAADGCGAVLHSAGIVAEHPPEVTFQEVNVEGTRNLVREAARAGVGRFVYVSSLGADRGTSEYHQSKKAAEGVVRSEFPGEWLVVRPGNVYGPGDEVVSLLLKMVRTLPVLPVIGMGDQPFQPVWADDLGQALAKSVEKTTAGKQVLEIAGPDVTTVNDLLDLMQEITDRTPVRIPIPEFLARMGTQAAEIVGIEVPVSEDQITMLVEENMIPPGGVNALTEVFGVTPTPLRQGLVQLADDIPEILPSEGTGRLHRERFWADIRGSVLSPEQVLGLIHDQFDAMTPDALLKAGAEPASDQRLVEGATLTLKVPLRGNVQVRVEEVTPRSITNATVEGHFFAGVIRFLVDEPAPGIIRFEVRAFNRAADLLDRLAVRTVGKLAQSFTWNALVEEVVRRSGGEAPEGVQSEDEVLSEENAGGVEAWVEELIMRRRRTESPGGAGAV